MEISIRIADESDVEVIFEIRTRVRENHLSYSQLSDMGITFATARAEMSTSTSSRTWIAEADGVPVGFAVAHADDGSVFALFIKPEMEGLGIGKRLMEKAEAFLAESHKTIWLETDAQSRANGFYRHLGWIPVERFENGDIRFEKTFPG